MKTTRINAFEIGLHFRKGELIAILGKGRHWFPNPFVYDQVDVVSLRQPWLHHQRLDAIVKSGLLDDHDATVIDLADNQRALVWVDKRFNTVLPPGLYVLWNENHDTRVEIVGTEDVRFEHAALNTILKSDSGSALLDEFVVEADHKGLYFRNGEFIEELPPGRYAFWKDTAKVKLYHKDLRGQMVDIGGQEIMTADKVTLRINGLAQYQVVDALQAVTAVDDAAQALYREAQLALRAVIGTKNLEDLLVDKASTALELETALADAAKAFGIRVTGFGIRDIILPGDMKELLNKVIEAKKVAEANVLSRREEVAAMRSQANTAKMLDDNPTLMRLKELEILEKVIQNNNLQVVLGDGGLTDKIVKLL